MYEVSIRMLMLYIFKYVWVWNRSPRSFLICQNLLTFCLRMARPILLKRVRECDVCNNYLSSCYIFRFFNRRA